MIGTIKLNNLINVFITSDPHFGHVNMCRGTSKWTNKEGTRNFDTVEEMNTAIVSKINDSYRNENSILICAGDWSFGGIDNIYNFRKQIKHKIIYLTPGNHDTHIIENKVLPNAMRNEFGDIVDSGNLDATKLDPKFQVRAQELFTIVSPYIECVYDNIRFCIMHYPILEWNDRGNSKIKHSYMLHGHQHIDNTKCLNRYDVGMCRSFNLNVGIFNLKSIETIIKEHNKVV